MASGESGGQWQTTDSRWAYWRRVLRPLYWWLVLVLLMYGYRLHQRLIEQTRVGFVITLQGKNVGLEAYARLDEKPVVNGQKISLGRHTFSVTHPKAVTFSTNFFGWYGWRDFGQIRLERAMGTLKMSAAPSAQTITITGSEFSTTLHNLTTTNFTVPTDTYIARAEYPHWSQSQTVTVAANQTATSEFAPRLGSVEVSCNQTDATGQLLYPDNRTVETVTFPYAAADLPEETYKFTARHNHDTVSQTAIVMAGKTNVLALKFSYGSLTLETEPSGALVQTSDGQNLGETPLKLTELKPGQFTLSLQHNGYEAATVSLAIMADQTISFKTNLVIIKETTSSNVSSSPVASTSTFSPAPPRGNLVVLPVAAPVAGPVNATPAKLRAIEVPKLANDTPPKVSESTVNQANKSKAEAERKAEAGLNSLQRAKMQAGEGNYAAAVKTLSFTVKWLPDNPEARALLAECRQQLANAKPQTDQPRNGKNPTKNRSQLNQ
jgi:hypothetical protein